MIIIDFFHWWTLVVPAWSRCNWSQKSLKCSFREKVRTFHICPSSDISFTFLIGYLKFPMSESLISFNIFLFLTCKKVVVYRIMASKDVHALIPGPVNILPYMAKGTLQMWLRFLRWENYPGLSGLAQCHSKGPYKRRVGVRAREAIAVMHSNGGRS